MEPTGGKTRGSDCRCRAGNGIDSRRLFVATPPRSKSTRCYLRARSLPAVLASGVPPLRGPVLSAACDLSALPTMQADPLPGTRRHSNPGLGMTPMTTLLVAEIIETVATIYQHREKHPSLAGTLLVELLGMLRALKESSAVVNVEASRALAAGMAASRANAVQEYMRRHGVKL